MDMLFSTFENRVRPLEAMQAAMRETLSDLQASHGIHQRRDRDLHNKLRSLESVDVQLSDWAESAKQQNATAGVVVYWPEACRNRKTHTAHGCAL